MINIEILYQKLPYHPIPKITNQKQSNNIETSIRSLIDHQPPALIQTNPIHAINKPTNNQITNQQNLRYNPKYVDILDIVEIVQDYAAVCGILEGVGVEVAGYHADSQDYVLDDEERSE